MLSISQAIQALSGGLDSEQAERLIVALEKIADCSCKGDIVYSPIGNCYPWQLPSGELFIPHSSQNFIDVGQVLSKGMGNGDKLKLTAITTLDPENGLLNIAINRGTGGSFHALSGAGNELIVEFDTVAGREWMVTITPQVPTSYISSCLGVLSLCPSLTPLSGETGKITLGKGLGGGQAFGKEPKPPSPTLPDNSLFYDVALGIPALVGRTGLIRVTFDVSPNLDLGGAVIVADMLGLKASLPLWSLAYLSAIHDTAVSQIKIEYQIDNPIVGGLVGRFILPRFQGGADLLATLGGGLLSSIQVNAEFIPD